MAVASERMRWLGQVRWSWRTFPRTSSPTACRHAQCVGVRRTKLISPEPLIRTRELVKVYAMGGETVRALDGVSVDIAKGEFVAVMGPSGSGKSTFMNVVGCLDRPTSGEYRLDGRSVSEMEGDQLAAVRNRNIGFVFQHFNLLARTP